MRPTAEILVRTAITFALLAAALFIPAGTLRIPEFWLYLAINAAVMAAGLLWLPRDLLEERMRPGGKEMDASYIPVFLVPLAHWITAGLDHRFHWTGTVPFWLQAAAFAGSC
jgi:hypothetical protein